MVCMWYTRWGWGWGGYTVADINFFCLSLRQYFRAMMGVYMKLYVLCTIVIIKLNNAIYRSNLENLITYILGG